MKYLKTLVIASILFLTIGIAFNVSSLSVSASEFNSTMKDSIDTKTYTCPMHPEVTSDKPGKCPKCGMDLEVKEENPTKEDSKNEKHNHKSHKGCMDH